MYNVTHLAAKQFHCDLGVRGIPVTYPTVKSYCITVGWHHPATRLLAAEKKKKKVSWTVSLSGIWMNDLYCELQYSRRAEGEGWVEASGFGCVIGRHDLELAEKLRLNTRCFVLSVTHSVHLEGVGERAETRHSLVMRAVHFSENFPGFSLEGIAFKKRQLAICYTHRHWRNGQLGPSWKPCMVKSLAYFQGNG